MWKNYFKIAYRNIIKDKGYSAINVFGLSLGIASSLLILYYIQFELSFDNFHPDADRVYRVDETTPRMLNGQVSSSTAPPLAQVMKTTYPEVEEVLRINTPGDFIIRYNDPQRGIAAFHEHSVFAADPTFFAFFGFSLREGNPKTALEGANKVVLSAETARKFFGDQPALGKILLLGDKLTAIEVTGVVDPQPANSHFHFDYLLSMDTNPAVKYRDWSWVWTQVVTYVRLRPDANPKSVEEKMVRLEKDVIRPALEKRGMINSLGNNGVAWTFYLRPMRDIHLKSGDNRIGTVGNIKYIYALGLIGGFVLLIATINFVNLATARSARRAKEVGVRKAIGAARKALLFQFQAESILITLFSTLLGLALTELLRQLIMQWVGVPLPAAFWSQPWLWGLIAVIPLFIGTVAGIYPSLYLTSFQPIQVLKGKLATGMGNAPLRNSLVLIQFSISIALIAGTLIVFQQLKFIGSKDLGFKKENVLLIQAAEKLGTHLEAYQSELQNLPGVTGVGLTTEVPGGNSWQDDISRENADIDVNAAIVKTDEQYFKTLGFQLVAGRTLEMNRPSDINAVVLNETMVRMLNWTPEQAVGQFLVYRGSENSRHEIIGVMKDFNYQSLRQAIPPLMFCRTDAPIWGDWRVLTIKFSGDVASLIEQLKASWTKALPDTPFEYSFLDKDLENQYLLEQQLGSLFGIFSGLSIFIAMIGLVGLVSYSAEVRKKEMGIRKVFGATTQRIVILINIQYIRLIVMALVISIPFTWWAMNQWLATFAFRVEVSPLVFAAAAATELALGVLSVGYLSWKAASMNPSIVLKEE